MTMKKKATRTSKSRYLIVNLNAFLNSYPLQSLTFSNDKSMQRELTKLMYNSYAVHENHPNISMIALIAATHGAYWQTLHGDKQLVKPLI
jgi:hypothetical protein